MVVGFKTTCVISAYHHQTIPNFVSAIPPTIQIQFPQSIHAYLLPYTDLHIIAVDWTASVMKWIGCSLRMWLVWFMVFNAIFINNISIISWLSVLLVEETPSTRRKLPTCASHRQTLSHNVVSSTPRMCRIRTDNVSGDRHRCLVQAPVVSIKDYNIGIYCFFTNHVTLTSQSQVRRHVYLRTVLSVNQHYKKSD